MGAAIHQKSHAVVAWKPLGFFFNKLDAAQLKYSAFDQELLACVSAVGHIRNMLVGQPVCIWTDNKTLTYTLSRNSDAGTARQLRHLSYLTDF